MAGPTSTNLTFHPGNKLERLTKPKREVLTEMFRELVRVYTTFLRFRFIRASRGDGTWPPLAPSTIARRKRLRRSLLILYDTGLMFDQITPELAQLGPVYQQGSKVMANVTYGGKERYLNGTRVKAVMGYHQTGGPRLPQRKIFVPPTLGTKRVMGLAGKTVLVKYIKKK